MIFELVNNILLQRGINGPTLDLLKLDGRLYSSMMLQISGSMEYGDNYLRFTDSDLSNSKFNNFFDLALRKNVNLAITPEYSCPWSVISRLLSNNYFLPEENNLWILGSEAIKASDLNEIIQANLNIEWIYDNDIISQNINNDSFFDPVCYIFRTRNQSSNDLETVVLIQFKTQYMGGHDWERDNLIEGEIIYVLENQEDSSRLFTFICSDVLNANLNLKIISRSQNYPPNFSIYPYLIIHIQLIRDPYHSDFNQYKFDIFSRNMKDKEIVCLNWGRNMSMNGTTDWNQYGGSGLYSKSDQLNLSDDRINSNHRTGLYYTRWDSRKSNQYILNYDEKIFLIKNTKVSQSNDFGVICHRTGPEVINTYFWDNDSWREFVNTDEEFIEMCNQINTNLINILSSADLGYINIERLVSLSVGMSLKKEWHKVENHNFFAINDNFFNSLITFTQDPNTIKMRTRRYYLNCFSILLNDIITRDDMIPDSIKDLRGNCCISYLPNSSNEISYNTNLYPKNSEGIEATGIYLGTMDITTVQEIYDKTVELFYGSQNGNRVVVWYNVGLEIESLSTKQKPSINSYTKKTKTSIGSTNK